MDLSRWIEQRADWSPAAPAFRFEGETLTYADMARRIAALAAVLQRDFAIARGDRVAQLGPSRPEVVELLFACARIGAVLVPLNWRLTEAEHRWQLGDCTPRLLVADVEFADHAEQLSERLDLPLLALGGPVGDAPRLEAAIAAAPDGVTAAGGLEDPLMLVYTSGTTGRPKGAVLAQRALVANAQNVQGVFEFTAADRVLSALPLFHVGGMNIQTTPALCAGACVVLMRRFDPGEFLRLLADEAITLTLAVPAVAQALVRHPDWQATDMRRLRMVGMGSSVVPTPLLRAWLERDVPPTQIYGLTESAPAAIGLRAEDCAGRLGSCGKPLLWTEARIADDDGRTLPAGARGEILLRGPNLFEGYWNNDAATGEAWLDGWFRTGDIGHVDEAGFFHVDDRKKDVIISGGENIYPAELEDILAASPDIAEQAVVGRPDPRWGEAPVACIVRAAGSELDAAGVLALFEGRLARYKHPREVRFYDSLPRNALGKVLKFELRDRLRQN